MALWASTAINTDELTMVFNQVWNKKFIDQVSNKKGLLEAILGKPSPNPDGAGTKPFERMRKISGKKIEVKLLGSYAEIGTISDGAAEVASTVGVVNEKYGAAVFDLTHYNHQHWVPSSQYKRYIGEEAKTLNYLQDEFDFLMASWMQTLAAGVSSNSNQSRTVLGGWEYAVRDATTGNTYGTIDRSDTANADFAGYEVDTVTLSMDTLQTHYGIVQGFEGKPDIVTASNTVYTILVNKIRDEGTLINNYGSEGKVAAGGASFSWQGMDAILDPNVTSGYLGMLESKSFLFYMDDSGMNPDAIVDRSKKSALLINMDAWVGLICHTPKHNGLLTTVT